MDKVYAPQDIERRIYERWESAWLVRAERPGHALLHHDPAAERHRHAAHGARLPAHAHGCADPLSPHARRATRCGSRAPTTPASPRRWWWSASSTPQGQQAHRPRRARHFVERVWKWKAQSGGTISAADAPARATRWTGRASASRMDPELSRAVTEVFVRLHDEGLIYRGKRLVNWDPVLLTALSDLEVQSPGGGRQPLAPALSARATAAATSSSPPRAPRPCSATPPSPCIRRMSATAHLIGKRAAPAARRPRLIPIIADTYVDPAFGSGCVKITPAHDFNDYEVGQRHELPLINIFTPARDAQRQRAGALPRPRPLRGAQARASRSSSAPASSSASRSTSSWCRAATAAARCSSPISPTSGT